MGQLIQFKIDKTRALVQATASFGSLPVVIWEYVVNGLAYQIKGKMPCVEVTIKKDRIEVTDNGRGMDQDDLANFFTGYAENKDRKEGNYVFKDYEMYNRYADLRKKCKRKPDYDF